MTTTILPTTIPASITTPNVVETRLGTLRFFDGLPDKETVETVYDNLDFQRGVQAFLAALPAAVFAAIHTGVRTFGPDNQTVRPSAFGRGRRSRLTRAGSAS